MNSDEHTIVKNMLYWACVFVIPAIVFLMVWLTEIPSVYVKILDTLGVSILWAIILWFAIEYWVKVWETNHTREETKAMLEMAVISVLTISCPLLFLVSVMMLVPPELFLLVFVFGGIISLTVVFVSYNYLVNKWEKKWCFLDAE